MPEETLRDMEVNTDTIQAKLNKLRTDKAPGADGMSPWLLKEIQEFLVTPIYFLMRKSLDEGIVPDDWRTAHVSPIYKKGCRDQASNYRPVSLTSQISKVIESMLRDVIVEHLERHMLIRDSQHGFRKGRSCLTNLLVFLDKVTESINDGISVDVIFLDFAKAFDKVPHQRLLRKLRAHGICGKILNWISAWLTNRRQRVCLQGELSGWLDVTSGVPQGSVLGPVLFLIFINDLDSGIVNWILKFADDTKIYSCLREAKDCDMLQDDLDLLYAWSNEWQMQFNVDKCKVMHIGKKNPFYSYKMNGAKLEEVTVEKDLGVYISNDAKPSVQCQQSYLRANRMLGFVKRNIISRHPSILLNMYKSFVRPHLEYCSPAWSPHYKKDKVLLERVQHRFTRLFNHLRHLDYSTRLNILGLWSLEERRNRADLIEVFKIMRGYSSIPVDLFFEVSKDGRTRGHTLKLVKHRSDKDLRHHFFSERVINRWNQLDKDAVEATSLNSFKNCLAKLRNRKMGFFMDFSLQSPLAGSSASLGAAAPSI